MKYKEVIMRYIYNISKENIVCIYIYMYGFVCYIVKYIMICVCFLYIVFLDI